MRPLSKFTQVLLFLAFIALLAAVVITELYRPTRSAVQDVNLKIQLAPSNVVKPTT